MTASLGDGGARCPTCGAPLSESGRARSVAIRELFDKAVALPASDQAAFLLDLSAREPELCAEVRSLLRAGEASGGFLEAALPRPDDLVGRIASLKTESLPRTPVGRSAAGGHEADRRDGGGRPWDMPPWDMDDDAKERTRIESILDRLARS